MNEAAIRDIVAGDLSKIDPELTLVEVEHRIVLDDGDVASIDILAKDRFGCFSVIEIKKSDQTARSAVQQLYKYARFLKKKYQLRVDQIRCIVASTHWRELRGPFSEFKHFSQYDSLGIQLVISAPNEYSAEVVDPPFETGGADAVTNFVFFEFRRAADRDRAYDRFIDILTASVSSLNSIVLKLDAKAEGLPNPFGFSWTIFKSDPLGLETNLSEWRRRQPLDQSFFSANGFLDTWQLDDAECALRTLVLAKAPIVPVTEGEYTCLALHSLNNTLNGWSSRAVHLHGPMFESGVFSEDDAIGLACGFLGDHPYNFVAQTKPDRVRNFNYVRQRLHAFLFSNSRWQAAVSVIFDSFSETSTVLVRVYNPLNFFGLITDLYTTGATERIPRFDLVEQRADGSLVRYFGTVIWGGVITTTSFQRAIAAAYPAPHEEYALLRAVNQSIHQYDENLFELYGLRHETFRECGNGIEWLNIDLDPPAWEPSTKDLTSLNDFFRGHDGLVEEAGRWFDARTA
jgi:Endonuclease NucS